MRAILIILMLGSLAGCDGVPSPPKQLKKTTSTYCIDGVLYYDMHYRLAPAFNQDSTVKVCKIGDSAT